MSYTPSKEQRAVIDAVAPVVVVLGGAGAGKTATASAAAARRLADDDAARAAAKRATPFGTAPAHGPVRRALFLSFSRTAVSQIVDRAASVLGRYQGYIDIVTFHGLAWRVLKDFGRHFGAPHPLRIRSVAETQLGVDLPGLTYDELMPEALRVLKIPTVREFYEQRYLAVICDEFQDTSDEEWEFMQTIAPSAQRLLLGDVNQCIYAGMKQIDPEARVAGALALSRAEQVVLPPQSFRDPSGILPAAAQAARDRAFGDPALAEAVRRGCLVVHHAADSDGRATALEVVKGERSRGHSVSVYTHTHPSTAELSAALDTAGVEHEQVGFTETYGDGLHAQFRMLRWALFRKPGARQALAVYLRSTIRGRNANAQGQAIIARSNQTFEAAMAGVVADLNAVLDPSPDINALLDVIRSAHSRLGFPRGEETWILANRQLKRAARIVDGLEGFDKFEAEVDRLRSESLVGNAAARPKPVQVMNLHQTKGREADATVLVLQDGEYHGKEGEPFPAGSKLLYVCMTRAREKTHIVVPNQVHPLWRPLIDACIQAGTTADGG